jgi:hypothetical protein
MQHTQVVAAATPRRTPRPLALTAGAILAAVMVLGPAAPASAATVSLPAPCPAILAGGDGAIFAFCKQLDRARKVANLRYAIDYSPAKQVLITRSITSLARRERHLITSASVRPQQLAIGINLSALKKFGGDALKVVQKVVGGAAKLVPQARVLNCGLFGSLAGAASFINGDTVTQVLVNTAAACIGINLPVIKKKP